MKRVIATITLSRTEDGGRHSPISTKTFGCPVFFEGVPRLADHGYDCRMLVSALNRTIEPGDTIDEIALLFLSPDEVIPEMKPGITFKLWEGRFIGYGIVRRIEEG